MDSTKRVLGALAILALALCPLRAAQQEQYRERETLDPATDQWAPLDPSDAPAGALDQARSLLARGKPDAAAGALKTWVEENPDDERYYEAVFLLGEAEFEDRDFYAAYLRYEEVVENTSGELFQKALRREIDVARAFLSGEKRILWKVFRLPAYDDGIEILDRVWERGPGTRLGEAALRLKADYYFETGEMGLAQDEYAHLAREYPSGRYVRLALLRSAEAAAAAFPGVEFDDRALLEAEARYEQVRSAFPVYAEQERIEDRLAGIRQQRAAKDFAVARWYERVNQAGAAEFYYRQVLRDWPDTTQAAEARSRLRGLGIEAGSAPEQESGS